MTQEPQKNNAVLIIIAIIGVVGTIVASTIGAIGNYNTEQSRQEWELTRIALVAIATSGGSTQVVLENTINAPTDLPAPTYTPPATYTPYPTFTDLPTYTAVPTRDALFRDSFSDVSGGWPLQPPLLLSDGTLTVSVEPNQKIWITIPNFKVTASNYIIQAEMQLTGDGNCYQGMGFALGEKDISSHKFLLRNECDGFGFLHAFVGFYDNNKELFRTELTESKPDFRKLHTIKLESRNGLFTLSYDGITTVSQQITPYGQDIGFYVENNEGRGTRIYSFDNLIVRELP